MRKAINFVAYGLFALTAGCAYVHHNVPAAFPVDHPDPKVSYPADYAGTAAAYVLGIPLDIIALPVTYPIYALDSDPDSEGWKKVYLIAPSIFTYHVVGNAVGVIPWLIWGWWGNEKYMRPMPSSPPTPETDSPLPSGDRASSI